MNTFIILRRELAANAVDVITRAYPEQLAQIQNVKAGDGVANLSQVRWAAVTPDFTFEASGMPQAYKAQRITLELQGRCDFTDSTLDPRFLLLCQTLEAFMAWPNLAAVLTSSESEGINVHSVTPEGGIESIEGDDFVVSYRMQCLVTGK